MKAKRKLFCSLLVLPLLCFGQKIEIKGYVIEKVDSSFQTVSYANIVIMESDSTFVSGVSCDNNGFFHIRGIEKGDYLLSASFVGYNNTYMELNNLSQSIDLGSILILSSDVTLNEVTISASNVINRIDRKIIFPDESQIKRSTDGIDLLRNLPLSGIDIQRSDNSITGARGGEVEIRINGVRASSKEALAINPQDVIRVEYHDEPSIRYGDVEVVIDYIVRRRESGGAVVAYFQKGIPVDWLDGYFNTKMNYKKSEFSLNGTWNRRHQDRDYRTNREVFNFQDGNQINRIEEGFPDTVKTDYYYLRFNYSYFVPDKLHFTANAGYYQYHNPVYKTRSLLYTEEDRNNDVLMKEYHYSDTKTPTVNLYYQHHLNSKQLIVLDVMGTYVKTDKRRDYSESKNEQILTNIISNINGKRYSIIGEGFYEIVFNKGRLITGIKYTRSYNNNEYQGNLISKTKMNQTITYFYSEWMGQIERFTYSAGVSGTQVHTKQGNFTTNDLRFAPSIRLGYQFNNKFYLQYRGSSGVKSPSLGDMNTVEEIIDSLQIRRGNPLLKPVTYFINTFTFSFNKKPFSANFQVYDQHSIRGLLNSIFEEDNKFIHMMENQKAWHQLFSTVYARATFLDGNLNIYTRGGLNWTKNWGDRYNHTLKNWFINGGIDYIWKNWNPFWEISTRRSNLSGESISYFNKSTYLGVRYRLKNISMSAYYRHSGGWDSARKNLNPYASHYIRNYSPSLQNILLVDIRWNFEYGRKYDGAQKKINNADGEN